MSARRAAVTRVFEVDLFEMSAKYRGECCGDPWPQLMVACARVVEIYSKIFGKPELMKISRCLKNVCKSCACRSKIVEEVDTKPFGFAFAPHGLATSEEIERFYASVDESIVPRLGTAGERVRKEKLLLQNPPQDENARNPNGSSTGIVKVCEDEKCCAECKKAIASRSFVVASPKMKDSVWHPGCFKCGDCNEFLQDMKHCVHEDSLFCKRHYAEKTRPRCSTCDELIFDETCTRAMGKNWHTDHFRCKECNVSLTGKKYAQKDDKPYCLKCYESSFGNSCQSCAKPIGTDAKYLIYKKRHWHEACFSCKLCQRSLVNREFVPKENEIFCERCHKEKLASRCTSCSKPFTFGTKTVEYREKQYHEECFVCGDCRSPIGTGKFVVKDEEIFCDGCYRERFGAKCTKCRKVIAEGGVTYRDQPWHSECFSCSNCPIRLSGVTFTSYEEKPYCAECFGMLFAKRCFACREPINGEGAKFVNYDSHHWHDNCFFCAACRCGLGGKAFVIEGDVILCPKCAKAKFERGRVGSL